MFDVGVDHYNRHEVALDHFERGLIDETRVRQSVPRLESLGQRFRDVTPDAAGMARVRDRFAEDFERSPLGTFTSIRLHLDPDLEKALLRMRPSEVETRLLRAARETLETLPKEEGLFYLAWGKDRPEIRAVLSGRRGDERPAPTLGPVVIQGLEATWHSRSYAVFELRPSLPRSPEQQDLLQRHNAARREIAKAVGQKQRGEIDQGQLRSVIERAAALVERKSAPARDASTMSLTLPKGRDFLEPLDPARRCEVLYQAGRAAGAELTHMERPNGDITAIVRLPGRDTGQFVERFVPALKEEAARHPDWTPKAGLEPFRTSREAILTALHFEGGQRILGGLSPLPRDRESRQGELIARFQAPLVQATREALGPAADSWVPSYNFSFPPQGHVHVRIRIEPLPGTVPARVSELRTRVERELPGLVRRAVNGRYGLDLAEGSLRKWEPRPFHPRHPKRLTFSERLGPSGDLLLARFRVERGIEYLKGLGLDVQQAILADAVRKAFPGLKEGFRPSIAAQEDGPALLARVTVPHAYLQDKDLIPSPAAQARFANEVYRMGGELQNRFHGEILPVRPARPRAAPTPTPAPTPIPTPHVRGLERISALAPAALRVGRTLLRWASELLPEED